MIRVVDERQSVEFYRQAFGLIVVDRLDFETFTLLYLSNPETTFELELTVNKGHMEAYVLGDGYGHLAVSVDDLDDEHRRLTSLGLNPGKLIDFQHESRKLARFFFISDPMDTRLRFCSDMDAISNHVSESGIQFRKNVS